MKPRTEFQPLSTKLSVTSIDVSVLTTLFDVAPDVAFFVKDVEGRYVTVNDSLAKRHGLKDKSDAIGKRPSDLCQSDFGQVPAKQDSQVLRTGRIRIAAASRKLRESKESVAEIAAECGFCDHSAFTRAFRNATGVTPSAFRDQS